MQVRACDARPNVEPLCSNADVIIFDVRDVHRFVMRTSGVQLAQIYDHEKDIARVLRQYTGPCSVIVMERVVEVNEKAKKNDQRSYDVYWYAINPTTQRICRKLEFR
ncbi:unnamed protein product [Anisakis simplex]|uniref:Uncharacterized protein n=1 Tax=Anisakis simplex TaxID=6269 RepID=A0A3P6PGE4_ANISI|nr:unnamed protein product [Anisakis simplex]